MSLWRELGYILTSILNSTVGFDGKERAWVEWDTIEWITNFCINIIVQHITLQEYQNQVQGKSGEKDQEKAKSCDRGLFIYILNTKTGSYSVFTFRFWYLSVNCEFHLSLKVPLWVSRSEVHVQAWSRPNDNELEALQSAEERKRERERARE